MALGQQGTFLRYDLTLTRKQHHDNIVNGGYPRQGPGDEPVLHIRREDVPSYRDLKAILEKVGGPYGWDRRKEYQDPANIDRLKQCLRQPESARYSFWAGNEVVGGAIVANIEEGLSRIYRLAREKGAKDVDPSMAARSIEIYKIGLFPEHTDKGWGRHFLPQLLMQLFNNENKPEVVYLNTRSTNHTGVLKFYMEFNMNVIHAQSHQDDLLPVETARRGRSPKTPPGDNFKIAMA